MPIYAFRCEECGHQFDRLQKLSDPDPELCPECGQAAVRRQVTAAAFRLAGKGWYETDFKSGKEKKHNLAGGAEGKADASVAGKSDGKAAEKAGSTAAETGSGKSAPAAPAAD